MDFENQLFTHSQLPVPDDIEFEGLADNYRMSVLANIVLVISIIIAVLTIARFQPFLMLPEPLINLYLIAVAAIIGLGVLIITYQFFAIPKKGVCLRSHDLHFTSGLIFRKVISQPILRIQHVELKRGPIERLFDLATLQVFSAGGATHTFEIPGMTEQSANSIRQFILSHKDTQQDG